MVQKLILVIFYWTKNYMKIFQFITFCKKTQTGPKPLRFRFNKIDGFNMVLDGKIEHLVLFDYGLLVKICDKIKYLVIKKVVLQMILIVILEGSKLIHIIPCLSKKY